MTEVFFTGLDAAYHRALQTGFVPFYEEYSLSGFKVKPKLIKAWTKAKKKMKRYAQKKGYWYIDPKTLNVMVELTDD